MKCSKCGHEWYTEKEYGGFECPACSYEFIRMRAPDANGGRNIVKKFQITANTYVTFTYNMDKYIQVRVPFEKVAGEKNHNLTAISILRQTPLRNYIV